jgi:hypothetical protein
MADNPDTRPKATVSVADTQHAPFIFYEGACALGFGNGVVSLTLSAIRNCIGADGAVVSDHVVTAYLRGNVQAAISLRDAINDALLLAAPTADGKEN